MSKIELSHRFKYPWEIVARAYLAKYPHKKLSHVESVDTLERYVDSEGKLVTSRILVSSFMNFSSIVGFEQSLIDQKSQTVELRTQNVTHTSLSESLEQCLYTSAGEKATDYSLKAEVFPAFNMKFLVKPLFWKIDSNFNKGIGVLEDIIVKKLGQPRYHNFEEFREKWGLLDEKKVKFKVLKQALPEIDILKSADFVLIREIIHVLAKFKNEVEVISPYLKYFADRHSIDKFKAYLNEVDKDLLKELIDHLKKKCSQNFGIDFFDDLKLKYGLREGIQ